jgi:Terpene synthase family 2, C-terminal metal binding
MNDDLRLAIGSADGFGRRYPLRQSRHYSEAFADAVNQRLLTSGAISPGRAENDLHHANWSYLASVCWPAADQRCLLDLACLAAALAIRDHEYDTDASAKAIGWAQAARTDLHSGFRLTSEPRWGPVFAQIWESLATYTPAPVMARLAAAIDRLLRGCVTDYERRLRRDTYTDLEDYLTIRRYTIGQPIDQVMCEISLGTGVEEHILTHPLTQHLLATDVDATIVAYDVMSLGRKLAHNDRENIVTIMAELRNCTLEEALHAAEDLYTELMETYDLAHAALRSSPLATHPDLPGLLQALHDFNSGLLAWTTGSIRYTHATHAQWPAPDAWVPA